MLVGGNLLNGTIPVEYDKLHKLEVLDLCEYKWYIVVIKLIMRA